MKPLGYKRVGTRGFTLIELLVVIAIIAIMAAILIPTIRGGMIKAEKTRAQTEMSQIVTAVKAYYSEYGKMPAGTGNNGVADKTFAQFGKPNTQNGVMDILRGTNTVHNPKGMIFLDVPKDAMSGTDKNGHAYVEGDGYFLDPWGNPYVISMDTDFNGTTTLLNMDSPSAPGGTLGATGVIAAVVSYGPNVSDTASFMTSWGMN